MTPRIDEIRASLELWSTDELVSILRNHDEDQWRPEVFEIVASILTARGMSTADGVALGPEGVDIAEDQSLVTVGRFFSPVEAHTARLALESAGVTAWVADEILGTAYGVGVGSRLQVRVEDARLLSRCWGESHASERASGRTCRTTLPTLRVKQRQVGSRACRSKIISIRGAWGFLVTAMALRLRSVWQQVV